MFLRCAACGSRNLTERDVDETLTVGEGSAAERIRAAVPIRHCSDCGEEWADRKTEAARRDAVERHLAERRAREKRERKDAAGAGAGPFHRPSRS